MVGFFFDNSRTSDFFENFLIISPNRIVVCTYYLVVQKYFNKLLGKPSKIKVFPVDDYLSITIKNEKKEIHINYNGDMEVITNFYNTEIIKTSLRQLRINFTERY